MTTLTETPSKIEQAHSIRREVMDTGWPESEEAQWAIGWALGELDGVLTVRDRFLNDPRFDLYAVGAPDMGLGEWDQEKALEYVDDQALQAAEALRKRLAEFKRRAAAGEAAEVLITARNMAQMTGGLVL